MFELNPLQFTLGRWWSGWRSSLFTADFDQYWTKRHGWFWTSRSWMLPPSRCLSRHRGGWQAPCPKKQYPLYNRYCIILFSFLSLRLCLDKHLSPRFEVKIKEGTKMLWKAGTVQLKNVKAKNVASYFSASQVTGSPAVTQAGNSLCKFAQLF